MSSNKLSAVFLGLGLAAIVVMFLMRLLQLGWILSILVGFLSGGALTIYLLARSRGEKPEDVAREVLKEAVSPMPDSITHRVENQLLQLNLEIRLAMPDQRVIDKSEQLIDLLLEIVPKAIQEAPHSEASFDLEKMSTDYFPDLIKRFLSLSAADQALQLDELLQQINDLSDDMNKAKEAVNQGKLNEFKVTKAFLNAKTSGM